MSTPNVTINGVVYRTSLLVSSFNVPVNTAVVFREHADHTTPLVVVGFKHPEHTVYGRLDELDKEVCVSRVLRCYGHTLDVYNDIKEVMMISLVDGLQSVNGKANLISIVGKCETMKYRKYRLKYNVR